MKRPKLPRMVHVDFTVDDGWNWRDEMEWHHEEYVIPSSLLIFNQTRKEFQLSKSKKNKGSLESYWLPQKIVNGEYSNMRVVEYEILKDLEAMRRKMDKYGFHTDINGEFDG